MDRQIVYPAQIPLDSDQLNAQRNAYVGLGQLAAMAYGWATVAASGFACTPGSGLALVIAPGSLLVPGVVDASAYGTLAAVASALVRQHVSRDPVTLDVPGAGATYTVYATPATVDADAVVLPFYNAADPSVTYAGADNSGKTAPTVRQDVAQIGIGTSVPAGAYPLWTIIVPAGATSITAGMIAQANGAPFYDTIPQLQASKQDTLGFTPVQQGAAAGDTQMGQNKVNIGWDVTGSYRLRYYVDGGATGNALIATMGDVQTLNTAIGSEAATRANADAAIIAMLGSYLPLKGGTITGDLVVGGRVSATSNPPDVPGSSTGFNYATTYWVDAHYLRCTSGALTSGLLINYANASIYFQNGSGVDNWQIYAPESAFNIQRYSAGSYVDTPFQVDNGGVAHFNHIPIAVTPPTSDSSVAVATTEFVKNQSYITGSTGTVSGGTYTKIGNMLEQEFFISNLANLTQTKILYPIAYPAGVVPSVFTSVSTTYGSASWFQFSASTPPDNTGFVCFTAWQNGEDSGANISDSAWVRVRGPVS